MAFVHFQSCRHDKSKLARFSLRAVLIDASAARFLPDRCRPRDHRSYHRWLDLRHDGPHRPVRAELADAFMVDRAGHQVRPRTCFNRDRPAQALVFELGVLAHDLFPDLHRDAVDIRLKGRTADDFGRTDTLRAVYLASQYCPPERGRPGACRSRVAMGMVVVAESRPFDNYLSWATNSLASSSTRLSLSSG